MKIIIEEYNPIWKTLFENEKALLEDALSGVEFGIEHIGSTSIEGLGAKPVIDILIGLNNFSVANDQIIKLTQVNYEYIDKYEDIMPYRRFFIKGSNGARTHHIHMVEMDSDFWKRHLAFRDYLINNPIERLNYYNLKKELSEKDWKDGSEYSNAKSDFIKDVERKATSGSFDS